MRMNWVQSFDICVRGLFEGGIDAGKVLGFAFTTPSSPKGVPALNFKYFFTILFIQCVGSPL